MNNQLQNTLRTLIRSSWQSNPAMRKIINDYAEYHTVFAIAGGLCTLILIFIGVIFWIKFNQIPQTGKFKWRFEKNVYFSFGLLSSIVALLMAFIVVVNATTAFDPLHGFSLLIDELTPSSQSAQLHHAYNDWIQSGGNNIPNLIEQHLHRRVMFHTTKAIVCGILLIIFTALSIRLWSTLIKRRNASETKWKLKEKTFFVAGIATIALSLLMMIIVIANLQGAVAPITLTLLFGAEFPVVRFDSPIGDASRTMIGVPGWREFDRLGSNVFTMTLVQDVSLYNWNDFIVGSPLLNFLSANLPIEIR